MTMGSLAVTDTLPPCGEVDDPLCIVAPSVIVRFRTLSEMSPTTADAGAVLLRIPLGAPRAVCPERRTASAVTVTFGLGAVLLAEVVMLVPLIIVSGPTVTVMSPATPVLPERDVMLPPLSIVKEEPEMVTGPRLSPKFVKLERLLEVPEMVSGPVALIVRPPVVAVLGLALLLEICEPPVRLKLPTSATMPPPSPFKPVAEVMRDAVSRLIAPDTRMSMARVAPTGTAEPSAVVLEIIDAPAFEPGSVTTRPSCRLPPRMRTVPEGCVVVARRPPASMTAPFASVIAPSWLKPLTSTSEARGWG
jgi:hypothetical protein